MSYSNIDQRIIKEIENFDDKCEEVLTVESLKKMRIEINKRFDEERERPITAICPKCYDNYINNKPLDCPTCYYKLKAIGIGDVKIKKGIIK